MRSDETERELLRLAQELDSGQVVNWASHGAADPALAAGIEALRDIEALAAALRREPELPDASAHSGASLEPGSQLGRYPIEREAGRGGMGVVYLARDPVLDRPVALKLLATRVARSPERIERFTREAKILASLNHPNVATIHGLEEDAGHRFLVLEWVGGETLAARLRRGPLPWREALEVCGQIARGLAAAHEGGVIHRDLKPGNVMITPQGLVKVLDFGLARRGGPSDPGVQGTWGYVSPECLSREEDHRADVFAFGCVLYECLAGVPAFPGENVDEVRLALLHREPDEARLPVDTPPAIRRLTVACLVKDPDRRLGSILEALRTTEAALGRRPAAAPSEAATAVPHRLPQETDAFVGREDELGELAERLRRGARLVTLQGPGGMGKTRLAVRYSWRSLEEWPGGVWFCDLTEARSCDGIVAAVAGALGVPLGQANAVVQLGHVIAGRGRCVIILDNFEQVVEHAEETIAPWLARTPDARFVVTSRERLDLPEEEVQTVQPLGSEQGTELFVERARFHRPGFETEGRDAESVRELVRLVEGMPLAIELAAARIRVMTPVQIVERMRERFRLLSGTSGGRHGTLRAAIDGSWELLAPWEQSAFAQCAVFDGGFTLAAAEAVLDLPEGKEAPWIPDVIQSLVDQSLLRTWAMEREGSDVSPDVRFGMFVSLQEYAREKLEESGVRARHAAEERHGTWYARHGAEEEMATLYRSGGSERRRALVRELDNLVAACKRAATRGDGATVAATYRASWDVLQLRGPSGTAVDLGREALAAVHDDPNRRRVLTSLGNAEWRAGRIQEGLAHLEEALALHREAGDRNLEGVVLGHLGALHSEQGRIEEGRVRLEEALTSARELGDRRREGIELARLGLLSYEQGRVDEALVQTEAALAIAREVGDRNFESQTLGHRALLHLEEGRTEEARAHFEGALALSREVGNRRFEGIMLHNLGKLDIASQPEQARDYLERSLAIAREVGSRSFEGHALSALGTLHLDRGRVDEARARLEAAVSILRELGERRFEGAVLGELGRLHLEQGRWDQARMVLAEATRMLREIDSRLLLATLLCTRAELERREGKRDAARATLDEAEALADYLKAGPDSDLRQQVRKVRQALDANL